MAETTNTKGELRDEPGLATLIIPKQLVEQVVDFVETLETGDDDVAGFMMLGGALGGRILHETTQTVTRCRDTNNGKDQMCDNDTFTTF